MISNKLPNAEFFTKNRERLIEKVKSDIVLIGANNKVQSAADRPYTFRQDSNFWYLTGVEVSGCILVIDHTGGYMIAPFIDDSMLAFEGDFDVRSATERSGLKVLSNAEGNKKLHSQLKDGGKVATLVPPEETYIPELDMHLNPSRPYLVSKLKKINDNIELEDIREILASMRSVKQPQEIFAIKVALQETKQLFEVANEVLAGAEHEYEIHAEILKHLILRGIGPAFDPIIASGKNALTLHYDTNRGKIDRSGLLLLDLGARAHGYNGDITRTIFGKPTERQSEIYNTVLDIQSYAISQLKPGVVLADYEETMYEYAMSKVEKLGITTKGKRDVYKHLTSHHLGIDVHDVSNKAAPLEPGAVLTVEPGLYLDEEGVGIRIEDVVLITEGGCEILSDDIVKEIDRLA